jgi:hypothetical protein
MQCYTVYFIWKPLYMFRVVPPPIIRSANNCSYSIWYLSDRYCYLPLSPKPLGRICNINNTTYSVTVSPFSSFMQRTIWKWLTSKQIFCEFYVTHMVHILTFTVSTKECIQHNTIHDNSGMLRNRCAISGSLQELRCSTRLPEVGTSVLKHVGADIYHELYDL